MKTTFKKIANLLLILSIPSAIFSACQEDIADPQGSLPPKSEIKKPPGSKSN